ncbi:hypothetical protein LCGC14_1360570 [marine sediment metagenome]|uniref:HNH nuclease domain-containing protein n=1 Tax=marine sediment metagenome TaxID=412755 RepID=A0A0F9KUB4_9ZZZZ
MKTIPGFPNYAITRDGQVWSKPRTVSGGRHWKGHWVKPGLVNGYFQVGLFNKSKQYHRFNKMVHRLVLETYVGPCPDGMECRHLNGNKQDNYFENLCWGTRKENEKDKVQHGKTKLTEAKVRVIRYLRDVAKFSLEDIAWQFDVCRATICFVVNRKTWKHI